MVTLSLQKLAEIIFDQAAEKKLKKQMIGAGLRDWTQYLYSDINRMNQLE